MPSPIPLPYLDHCDLWASRVAAHADLADERLNTRLEKILSALAAKPADSIPQAAQACSQAKAMYRFFANQRFGSDDLLQPVIDATTDSLSGLSTLLAVQDTTSLNFSTLKTTKDLGPLNDSPHARGLHLHTTLAMRDDGVPLGILGQSYWARTPGKHTAPQRRERPIQDKESRKWLDGIEAAENALEALPASSPRPRLIHLMDREGDIHEVLQRISASPHFAVIRVAQNRSVAGDVDKAYAALETARLFGTATIDVPRVTHQPQPQTPQRQATLELRAVALTVTADREKHPHREPVTWMLVEARESNAPAGTEPLHWRLWTNLAADTRAAILLVLKYYGLRWRVEDFHLTLKSGCQIEKLELEAAERLIKAAILYSAVAVRVIALRDLARVAPETPCTTLLSEYEWQALWVRFSKEKLAAHTPPPNLKQAVLWIGRLGGHLGRRRDGMPGVRTLWRGLRDLSLLAAGLQAGRLLR